MIYLVSNTAYFDDEIKHISLSQIVASKPLSKEAANKFDALIITSKNALLALDSARASEFVEIFAISTKSANAARKLGFRVRDFKADSGLSFANMLIKECAGRKLLYLRAKNAALDLCAILNKGGVRADEWVAYESLPKDSCADIALQKGSIFIFASPLNFRLFYEKFGWDESFRAISIGTSTQNELLKAGITSLKAQAPSIKECVNMAKTLIHKANVSKD